MSVTDTIVEVPIAVLERHHFTAVRRRRPQDDLVDVYAQNLDSLPLGVVWWTGKRWEVLDGRHRTAGGRKLGRKTMRCRVFEGTEAEAQLYMLHVNAVHGSGLEDAEVNEAIKRALRLGLDLGERKVGALFNRSHTHVAKMRKLVAVEDHYRRYLIEEGVPEDERQLRQTRVGDMYDGALLKVYDAPKEFWGPLLDAMPGHGWGAERYVAQELARLQGKDAPEDEPSAVALALGLQDQKTLPSTPRPAQTEPEPEPDPVDVYDRHARSAAHKEAVRQERLWAWNAFERHLGLIEGYITEMYQKRAMTLPAAGKSHVEKLRAAAASLSTLADLIDEAIAGRVQGARDAVEEDGGPGLFRR